MPNVNIGDIKIYYTRTGKGEPIVIFPDNILTSSAYQDEINYFSERYEVIAFDYPTTGKSSHEVHYPDERQVDYWGFYADIACHLLQSLAIKECFALGISGGALAALHFAGRQSKLHKIRVRGLVLDSFRANWDRQALHRWLDVREHFYVRNEKSLIEQHGDDWRAVVNRDTEFLRSLADRGGYLVADSILNNISCPTLLTGYLQDPIISGLAQEYVRISSLIPDCSIFLSSTSHHPYIERPYLWSDPEGFQKIADLFLNRIDKVVS